MKNKNENINTEIQAGGKNIKMKKVTLENIAGYEIEKEEVRKIIGFLKNYKEYTEEGISLPKGLLFTGTSGVGKTLFATAIANEANVNFVKFENADQNTVENIKKYFVEAKAKKPSILFIDELDQLLPFSSRGSSEVTKILQTFLTEIDGINTSEGVLVIATAMRNAAIFGPLTRSGRIEKQIKLSDPNCETRVKILDYYLSMHKEFDGISRETIAKKTEGFNGASIKRLANEVLLQAKSKGAPANLAMFEEYIPVIHYNDLKRVNEKDELKTVIPHEIGHFIVNYVLNGEVGTISVAKFSEVGGFMRRESKKGSKETLSVTNFENKVAVLLGGMAGERVICNDTTAGCTGDLDKAKELILDSMQAGLLGFEYSMLVFYDYEGNPSFVASDAELERTNKKRNEILNECYLKAQKIIKENLYIYDLLKDKLYENDTLGSEDIALILNEYKEKHK